MKVSLIVLTRNELTGVKNILPKIPRDIINEIVVIDGNSTDGTYEECQKMNLEVIKQKSKGRGNAFREGLNNSKGDILIFFSPDGNENPEDIPRLITKISEGYDLVIASRLTKGGGSDDFTFLRKMLTMLVTKTINILFKGSYTDACNGFRAIKRSVLESIRTDATWHEIEIQISIRCLKRKCRISEIPTFEDRRIAGTSNLNLFTTGIRHMWYILKEIFSA